MPRRVVGVLLVLATLALGGSAGAASGPAASASALGVRVVVPGGEGATAGAISSPPQAAAAVGGFSFGDGAVTTGAISAGTRAGREDGGASAAASATVRSVSLFDGEITVDAVESRGSARASGTGASSRLGASTLAGVTVLGSAVDPSVNARVPLDDWGYAVLLEQAVVRHGEGGHGERAFVTGLHVHLTAEHGGLPAGTEILVGYAEAAASAPKAAPPPPPPPPTGTNPKPAPTASPSPAPKRPQLPREPQPQAPGATPAAPPPIVQDPPASVQPRLTADGYVFPVYGSASFTDDFRAGRASTGWHHGNDIFAPLGAPVLAVADGTLFLVGWNAIGGNRLWLRDGDGNEFYYAHLSAYSPLARDGAQVRAGDVIGFVGTTGDAEGTPPHLHFEIHPAGLLWLGYDGVIDPFAYLTAWRRLEDVDFDASWTPPTGPAPPPGAVLLQAEDISAASGLDPAAFAGLLTAPDLFGEGPAGPTIVNAAPGFGAGADG